MAVIKGVISGGSKLNATLSGKSRLKAALSKNTYMLPPATRSTLGGVIVGSNVDVKDDGTISVSSLTNSDIESLIG